MIKARALDNSSPQNENILTYRILKHGRRDLHDVGKDGLAAEPAGQPVQCTLRHHGVAVAIFLLQRIINSDVDCT